MAKKREVRFVEICVKISRLYKLIINLDFDKREANFSGARSREVLQYFIEINTCMEA